MQLTTAPATHVLINVTTQRGPVFSERAFDVDAASGTFDVTSSHGVRAERFGSAKYYVGGAHTKHVDLPGAADVQAAIADIRTAATLLKSNQVEVERDFRGHVDSVNAYGSSWRAGEGAMPAPIRQLVDAVELLGHVS
jgi:hypothetical protein